MKRRHGSHTIAGIAGIVAVSLSVKDRKHRASELSPGELQKDYIQLWRASERIFKPRCRFDSALTKQNKIIKIIVIVGLAQHAKQLSLHLSISFHLGMPALAPASTVLYPVGANAGTFAPLQSPCIYSIHASADTCSTPQVSLRFL